MFRDAFLKYKKGLVVVLFFSIIANLLSLAVPLSFMAVIDRVLVSSGYATLNVIFVILVVVALSEAVVNGFTTYLFNWCSNSIIAEVAGKFFHQLFHLKRDYFQRNSPGDTMSRIGELDTIKAYISDWMLAYSVDILFMLIFLSVMLSINATLSLVILATVPLHLLQYFIFGKALQNKNKQVFVNSIQYNSAVLESLSGIEVIKNEGKEKFAIQRVADALGNSLKNGFSLSVVQLFSAQISATLSKISEAVILFVGAYLVLGQKMSLGELVAFNMMKDRVTAPLLRTASLWEEMMQFRLSRERIDTVMSQEGEATLNGCKLPNEISSIEFRDVNFSYEEHQVIDGFSLRIEPNSITCLVGESGAGKSTVTRLLARLSDNYQGRIEISGKDIRHVALPSLREKISYVNQDNMLFSGTIRDNILFSSPRLDEDWLYYCAKLAWIHEFIISLPLGYDTPVIEGGKNFSGGQVQRIAIARALASDKPILIFDEATSALDYESEYQIVANLKQTAKHKTLIAITHRLSLARCADNIVCMAQGKIIEQGSHNALIQRNGFYRRLHNYQMGDVGEKIEDCA
ncbi:peptidase domain-containing ABC transporter [Photobacterium sanguinicancri]|uniref:peptidase domain-containing ABC transporter n=1 Tax=Photobacterium sanguinicancri TaxID=875932 RepID=UPI0026E42DEF|nr:peptidase domain-containing ABC transporter [Photobacterium sanguinicancri]MDO6498219.1 peptidase domain-containing ABC transporter [Photobacterium sanguinicancri]